MIEEFIAILKKLIADKGLGILDDAKICHNLLLDYGKGTYKREIKWFKIALENGFYEKLLNSSNRDLDKRQMAEYWHEDEGVDIQIAEMMLNCLCHILFNDSLNLTSKKASEQLTKQSQMKYTILPAKMSDKNEILGQIISLILSTGANLIALIAPWKGRR
jgi:hypothetical protein